MTYKYWKISPESGKYAVTVEGITGTYAPFKAFVKWDGCTQILFNEEDEAYKHPCHLPEFIESMQELLEISQEYFCNGCPLEKEE